MSQPTQEVINMEARPGDTMNTGTLSPTRLQVRLDPHHGVQAATTMSLTQHKNRDPPTFLMAQDPYSTCM
jgi:hypothetical protein